MTPPPTLTFRLLGNCSRYRHRALHTSSIINFTHPDGRNSRGPDSRPQTRAERRHVLPMPVKDAFAGIAKSDILNTNRLVLPQDGDWESSSNSHIGFLTFWKLWKFGRIIIKTAFQILHDNFRIFRNLNICKISHADEHVYKISSQCIKNDWFLPFGMPKRYRGDRG